MVAANLAEERFAAYLNEHGYAWKHEPDYQAELGLPKRLETRPDFLIERDGAELRYLNATLDRLNAAIRRAADAVHAAYVDVTDALDRHELSCRSGSWVNPLREGTRFPYSFHPNGKGQIALAGAVKLGLRRLGLG